MNNLDDRLSKHLSGTGSGIAGPGNISAKPREIPKPSDFLPNGVRTMDAFSSSKKAPRDLIEKFEACYDAQVMASFINGVQYIKTPKTPSDRQKWVSAGMAVGIREYLLKAPEKDMEMLLAKCDKIREIINRNVYEFMRGDMTMSTFADKVCNIVTGRL